MINAASADPYHQEIRNLIKLQKKRGYMIEVIVFLKKKIVKYRP